MPEARLKREASEPKNEITSDKVQQVSALLNKTVEQICSAMSASGVVLAVRDPEGVRCLASTGDAPAVGSQLQPDSTFTRTCLETGEVVLCEDAENDSRIQPSVAKSLNLRSAVAVPIKAQGSVIGVLEVFSPRPSDIEPADVETLKGFAKLFALTIARQSPPPHGEDGAVMLGPVYPMEAGPPEPPVPPCEKTTEPLVLRCFEPVAKTQPPDPIYAASPTLLPSDSVPIATQSPDSGALVQDDSERIVRDLRSALCQADAAQSRFSHHHRRRIWHLIFWALMVLAAIIAVWIAITEWMKP
jgi:hypothetical protein